MDVNQNTRRGLGLRTVVMEATNMVIINKKPFLTELCVCQNLEDFVVVIKHLITTLGATFVSDVVLVAVKISF